MRDKTCTDKKNQVIALSDPFEPEMRCSPKFLAVITCFLIGHGACVDDSDLDRKTADLTRLLISNSSLLLYGIMSNETCGFKSPEVSEGYVLAGEDGSLGTATYLVQNCAIDFDTESAVLEDCEGQKTTLHGQVTVTATITVMGTITGDRKVPIIPRRKDSIRVHVGQAELKDFKAQISGKAAALIMKEGSLSYDAILYGAVNEDTGLCTSPTDDITIENLSVDRINVKIESDEGDSYAFLVSSALDAQIGQGALGENNYTGRIRILGLEVDIPPKGEEKLDPDYERSSFESRFLCKEKYSLPLDYNCDGGGESDLQVALGAARSSVQLMATIAELIEKDEVCGFSSNNAKYATRITGDVGEVGVATTRIDRCVLEVPLGTTALEECDGSRTTVAGRAVITAVKSVSGIVTGEINQPIAPVTDSPAVFHFEEIALDKLSIMSEQSSSMATELESDSSTTSAQFNTGLMSGRVRSRFTQSRQVRELCGFQTPIAEIEVAIEDTQLSLMNSAGERLSVKIEDTELVAVNGSWNGQVNTLTGTITVGELSFSFPRDSGEGLIPNYDQQEFDEQWQCNEDIIRPLSFACDPTSRVIDTVTRLTPLALATVVRLLEENIECGFESPDSRDQAIYRGEISKEGIAETEVKSCKLEFPIPTVVHTDCNGLQTIVSGSVVASGEREITGFLTGHSSEPVVPTKLEAINYDLSLSFTDFHLRTSDESIPVLQIPDGDVTYKMSSRLAYDRRTGACSLPTPMARFEDIRFTDALVSIESDGSLLGVQIQSSDFGADTSTTNTIDGTVQSGDRIYQIPSDGGNLRPEFNVEEYRSSYKCDPNLVTVSSDRECSYRVPLGTLAAALIGRSLAEASALSVANQQCGFRSGLAAPVAAIPNVPVVGPPALGSVTTGINMCELAVSASVPVREDCLRNRTIADGAFTVTGTQTVTGLRTELVIAPGVTVQQAIPVGYESVGVTVNNMSFLDFAVYTLEPGSLSAALAMSISSGSVSYEFKPYLGEELLNAGVFSIPTPLASLSNIIKNNLIVQINIDGRQFGVTIDESEIDVSINRFQNTGNTMVGWITMDGQKIELPLGQVFDPNYNQTLFDLSYDCTPNLKETLPWN